MTEIPEDIREKAEGVFEYWMKTADTVIADLIARALLAERIATEARVREECAKIAEADAASRSEMEGYGTAKASGHRIAAAIRETAR